MRSKDIMTTPNGLRLEFRHFAGTSVRCPFRANGGVVTCRYWTVLQVWKASSVWATGESFCSPEDNLDYEIGRQRAVYNMLTRLPKGNTDGAALKTAYLSRPGASPWALDRHGHVLLDVLKEHRSGRAAFKRLQRSVATMAGEAE